MGRGLRASAEVDGVRGSPEHGSLQALPRFFEDGICVDLGAKSCGHLFGSSFQIRCPLELFHVVDWVENLHVRSDVPGEARAAEELEDDRAREVSPQAFLQLVDQEVVRPQRPAEAPFPGDLNHSLVLLCADQMNSAARHLERHVR